MTVDEPVSRFVEAGVRHDLIGDPEPAVHLRNTEAFAALIGPGERILDLGSGAGLPGLLLARIRPDLTVTLLEASARRCRFLEEWRLELAPAVDVIHGRAELVAREPAHRRAYDCVTARSFGRPAVTAECGVGFLRMGGRLLVSEPPAAADDRWPQSGLSELGLSLGGVHASGSATIQVLRVEHLDDRFPRGDGRPAKRPLF